MKLLKATVLPFFFLLTAMFILPGCVGDSGGSGGGDGLAFDATSIPDISQPDIPQISRSLAFCGVEPPDSNTLSNLSILFEDFNSNHSFGRNATTRRETVIIPVFFHVISAGPAVEQGEVPDNALIEQIEILNRAFSGESGGVATPFRFHLAGINRVRNPEWHVMSPGSQTEIQAKEQLKIGGVETLNIYVVDIQTPEGTEGTVLGYATIPVFYSLIAPFDGIVLNFRAVPSGSFPHYNTGNVAVHEAGHWLGLMHTFQGECDGLISDLIHDTPRERIPEPGNLCPIGRNSCPHQPGTDPIHNHMTYTADDCRFEFTQGQVDFMIFNAFIFRRMPVF